MKSTPVWAWLAWLALYAPPTSAADLTKIDRAIAKQPVYQSQSPKYCLLVFGPEAKTRVWLVLDGDVLYVDRNGNGDLTEKGERIVGEDGLFVTEDITEPGGKTRHTQLRLRRFKTGVILSLLIEGKRLYFGGSREASDSLTFADQPRHAPILHVNGPLSLKLGKPRKLLRGNKDNRITVTLGTPGLGQGTLIHASAGNFNFPKDVHPVAQIEFPSREKNGVPVKVHVALPRDT
jgi:hypothetical protein